MPFDPNQPFDKVDKFDPSKVFEKIEPTDSENEVLAKVTDFVHKQAVGTLAGINQLIPFSDQISAAGVVAKQLLTGEISYDQIPEQFRVNTEEAIKIKKQGIADAPAAAGIGMGLGAVAQTVATAGVGPIVQAGLATGQTAGIAGGEALAEGKSYLEAGSEAAQASVLGAGLAAAPQILKTGKEATKVGIRKLKDIIGLQGSGLSAEEEFGRKALKVLGASKSQSVDLLDDAPELAKTLKEKNVLQSGFEQKSLIWKRANEKLAETGDKIKETYAGLKQKVSNSEVRDRIMLRAKLLEEQAPKANAKKIKALMAEAKKFDDNKSTSVSKLWEERKAIDNQIYNTNQAIHKTGKGVAKKEVLSDIRTSIQNSINKKIVQKHGADTLEDLEILNRDFSNLSIINKLAKRNQFASSPKIIDKLTVGSAVAASRHPVVGGALITGRPLLQYFGPRSAFTPKIIPSGVSKKALIGPTVSAFEKLKKNK